MIEKRVTELVEEKIADKPDLFLVDVKLLPNGKLMILIDGDKGVGIDVCAQVSRYVGHQLEEEGLIEKVANLEVSSPGIDAALTLNRQYVKNIGRQVSVKNKEGLKKEGRLLSVTDESLTIEEKIRPKGKKAELVETSIPLDQITETKVLISFK